MRRWKEVLTFGLIEEMAIFEWFIYGTCLCFFFSFSTRPPLGLLPVLGPLGSGKDTTHQPSPALRLLG